MPSSPTSTLKLRPADPFDLIRWLARSQSDPRKAVAELVQNSLDANARRVMIERRRVRRAPALVIRDDGEGIVPELSREAALRAIATNIGHSRKRGLSPRERHDEIVAGKYGIGLLGFWSVGHRMEIRSRVGGGDVWVLRMVEEQEAGGVAPRSHGIRVGRHLHGGRDQRDARVSAAAADRPATQRLPRLGAAWDAARD